MQDSLSVSRPSLNLAAIFILLVHFSKVDLLIIIVHLLIVPNKVLRLTTDWIAYNGTTAYAKGKNNLYSYFFGHGSHSK